MVTVQFANSQQDQMSEVLAPYDYVEITYGELWSPDRKEQLAYIDEDGSWIHNNKQYSEVTIV